MQVGPNNCLVWNTATSLFQTSSKKEVFNVSKHQNSSIHGRSLLSFLSEIFPKPKFFQALGQGSPDPIIRETVCCLHLFTKDDYLWNSSLCASVAILRITISFLWKESVHVTSMCPSKEEGLLEAISAFLRSRLPIRNNHRGQRLWSLGTCLFPFSTVYIKSATKPMMNAVLSLSGWSG